jgi:peptidyl-prolyl cis-trans isomerase SurA
MIRIFKNLSLLVLFVFLVLTSTKSVASKSDIFVLAKINNQIITNIDLINRYKLIVSISKIKFSSQKEKQIIFNQLLNTLVDENLQINEAKNLGINLDQEKFNQSLEQIAKSQNKTITQFKNSFDRKSISYQSFFRQIESQILWSQIIRGVIVPKIKISQSEIDELLEFRKIESNIKKSFLSEIYIPFDYKNGADKIDSKSLVSKLYDEITKGKNFQTIIKQFSKSATAEFNGEIGWVSNLDVDKRISSAIQDLKIGQISQPVLMDDGYYLFKVNDQKTFSTLTDEDLEQIQNIIFNRKLQLASKSYLMQIRKKSYIEVDQKKLLNSINNVR